MSITVRFSKRGFYHPAFGRLGMGDNAGRIYELPDFFKQPGMLPTEIEILDGMDPQELEEILEDADQSKPIRPKLDRDELARAEDAEEKAKDARKKASAAKVKADKAKKAKAEKAAAAKAEAEAAAAEEAERLAEEEAEAEAQREEDDRPKRRRRSRRAVE